MLSGKKICVEKINLEINAIITISNYVIYKRNVLYCWLLNFVKVKILMAIRGFNRIKL